MTFDPALSSDEVFIVLGGSFANVGALGAGGQGTVFTATHVATGEPAALKIYHANQVEERAQREIDAMKRIQGDTLVSLIDSGHVKIRGHDCVYVATKFIEGETLVDIVDGKNLDVPQVAQCACDILRAIELLWGEHIVHRDINPKNIMITREGRAILIDLGVARHLDLRTLTLLGCTCGTMGYLSPEQARAVKQLSYRSDIFALGITLQECLLGRHPTNRQQQLLLAGGPTTATLRSGLPMPFAETLDSMVRLRAYERPRISELCDVFERFTIEKGREET